MDLIIRNASLEEVTDICYRIGEPNFEELAESNRKFGVVDYLVKHGTDLNSAVDVYDKELQDSKTQAVNKDTKEETPETTKETQPVPEEVPLHLDKATEEPKEPVANLEDNLHQLATQIVKSGRSKELIKILNGFGAKSVPELNKNHYEAVIEKIKEIL